MRGAISLSRDTAKKTLTREQEKKEVKLVVVHFVTCSKICCCDFGNFFAEKGKKNHVREYDHEFVRRSSCVHDLCMLHSRLSRGR